MNNVFMMEVETLKAIYHIVGAIILSIIISLLRILGDNTETSWKSIIIESLLCGAITAACTSLVIFLNWNISICSFIGGTIGLLGSAFVRNLARKVIIKKADKNEDTTI